MAEGALQSLRDRVEQTIAGSGETVVSRVVDTFVDAEVKRRADLLTAAVNAMRQLETDLRKIKPNSVLVDENGVQVSSAFTPDKQKELVGHKQRMKTLDDAIAVVLEKQSAQTPDGRAIADAYNKLDGAIKKVTSKGGGGDNKGGGDTE